MRRFFCQPWGLIYKNVLTTTVRRPAGFVLSTWFFPTTILALLLSIPSFLQSPDAVGISDASLIRPLADVVDKKLVIVRPPEVGKDVDSIIDTFTETLPKNRVALYRNESSLESVCLPNARGVSDCHAIVIFKDSPLTASSTREASHRNSSHTWQYIIRGDPARDNRARDFKKHKSDQEDVYLPLQLAINNAITNSTAVPETIMFAPEQQGEMEQSSMVTNAAIIARIYAFALVLVHFSIVYRLVSFITSERESGMSQLIDSMGGRSSIYSRVVSWAVITDLAALPTYIAMGFIYQRLAFPTQSAGIIIGWQVMNGFAINSSVIFAASFFSKARLSAVCVNFLLALLSIIAQMYASESKPHPQQSAVAALSLLFPSANNVYFTQQMSLWQLSGLPAAITEFPPEAAGLFSSSYKVSQSKLLNFLVIDIFLYLFAAMAMEKVIHGVHYRKRKFEPRSADSSRFALEVLSMTKTYSTASCLSRTCCCCCKGTRKRIAVVDGVTFQTQKGQITCLVGPNGSGKTTLLHMMAGFTNADRGSVSIKGAPSQIGICPQRNILWDTLTVAEHVKIWNIVKSGRSSPHELEQLIEQCDLAFKRNFRASSLSGGQKRKLQLACMFTGDSSICLVDECTSGLDPLSRRTIWEILLEQRAKRSIILTTHFLDEVDVLADYIVLLCKGTVKCQGIPAELKDLHSGGYKVSVPLAVSALGPNYPRAVHQDRAIYYVPSPAAASKVACSYLDAGITDVALAGPQFEDVFLNILQREAASQGSAASNMTDPSFKMSPGKATSSWKQFLALYRKRWTVLPRFWSPYLFALLVPLGLAYLAGGLLKEYEPPSCDALQDTSAMQRTMLKWNDSCTTSGDGCDQLLVSPEQANGTLFDLFTAGYVEFSNISLRSYSDFVSVQKSRKETLDLIARNTTRAGYGGIFTGTSTEAPTIAYRTLSSGEQSGSLLLGIWSQMQGGTEIRTTQELIPKMRKIADFNGIAYMLLFTLLQVLYPASFVLYPALEKARQVRAMQYANGIRPGPLWAAYTAFDLLWIAISSASMLLISAINVTFNGPIVILLPVLSLYGMTATLTGYVISHYTEGPLKAYLATVGVGMLSWVAMGFAVNLGDANSAAVTFGANLVLPIGNVFRSLLVGLNLMDAGCSRGNPVATSSLYGFAGPLLYLMIQVAALLLLVTVVEMGRSRSSLRWLIKKSAPQVQRPTDIELAFMPLSSPIILEDAVQEEKERAESSDQDSLRVLHVSKSFGTNRAVDDVTFGLSKGQVIALLGPNGAGKSTLVSMIQANVETDKGQITLCQEDNRNLASGRHLGVCPQFDASDLMSTRQQLSFYARVKGISDISGNVNYLLARLDLTSHRDTQVSKLSGGNKRKVMLAIALMGSPAVLVLDEPTTAMDAIAKRQFWNIVQDIAGDQSVLLTACIAFTHGRKDDSADTNIDAQHGGSRCTRHSHGHHGAATFSYWYDTSAS
ncbi:hypothetical protein JDV02_010699 [Purpureocillium takamizusanense]|uniref:ABC transporter domain-containing protein n=1 Tax=Purpureocillium takamizusanense TaxID=2060973 RepID=A0A9Q8QR47_9HYPO|nr:uncharacterized protein JDV02_010699 [Purpureocillium takamizusanense]UNI24988.1 hypothetical protein JDV02_010699 [Purpureocillium takamizusanense]